MESAEGNKEEVKFFLPAPTQYTRLPQVAGLRGPRGRRKQVGEKGRLFFCLLTLYLKQKVSVEA